MTNDITDDTTETSALSRVETFDAPGPVEIDVAIAAGRVDIELGDEPGIQVEIKHDPALGDQWGSWIAPMLNWANEQFGSRQPSSIAEMIRQTRVDFSGRRLVVRTPKAMAAQNVPLLVSIRAPRNSHVDAKSGSAPITVHGTAGRVRAANGMGDITVQHACGAVSVSSGMAAVHLGTMESEVRAKTGTGDLEVSSVGTNGSSGPGSALRSGSGNVWLGEVQGDITVSTGSGDIQVADAVKGRIELFTGSGDLRVGVRQGVSAAVNLLAHWGQAHSELPISDTPPSTEPAVSIRGRTGSGSAVVNRASS